MQITLEDYGVANETGFVPVGASQRLPCTYEPWERFAEALSSRLKSGTFLEDLDSLPQFSIEGLGHENQWQRAYLVLAFVTHALVHGCQRATVPLLLSEPFLAVCDHLGVQPVLSYAGLCLYNWGRSNNPDVLQGLKAEISFTNTLDEAAFYLVPVLVELAGGRLPALLLANLTAASEGDWTTVTRGLEICSKTIVEMTEALQQLSLCNPQTFYHQIRPFIAGLDVHFERADGKHTHVKVIGGSAVQSSLFMFLDQVLGVNHGSQIMGSMRQFMPRGHRLLLEKVSREPSLLELMETKNAPSNARSALVECRSQLQKWRSRHIAIVTRYVVLPAQAAARGKDGESVQVVGTAGSSPLPFLKEVRDDTPLR